MSRPQRARVRRRRWVRPLLAVMVVLVVAVAVVEQVAPRVAERRVADALVTRFSLTERPRVDLGGFPFLLRAASGELDQVQVSLRAYTSRGLRFADLHLVVGRITYPPTAPLRGGTASASSITGTASVTETDLAAYLRASGSPLDVRLTPGRVTVSDRVTVGGVSATVTAGGTLVLDGQWLSFRPDDVALGPFAGLADVATWRGRLAFTAPIPDLAGIQVQSITIGDGVAVAHARIDDMTFTL